jgi:hypothetical protein
LSVCIKSFSSPGKTFPRYDALRTVRVTIKYVSQWAHFGVAFVVHTWACACEQANTCYYILSL